MDVWLETPVIGCVQEARGTGLDVWLEVHVPVRGCVQEARGTGLEMYG